MTLHSMLKNKAKTHFKRQWQVTFSGNPKKVPTTFSKAAFWSFAQSHPNDKFFL